MSNLKKMFYRDYYEDVQYGEGEAVKEYNARLFRSKNQDITNYEFDYTHPAFSVLDISCLGLEVSKFELATTNPGLIIGTGYMHELHTEEEYKLGFFFDHTTGLPILPGSSVKGVLRSAFPNFEPKKDDVLAPDFLAKDKKGNPKITEKQKQKAYFIQELVAPLEGLEGDALFTKVHQLEWILFEGLDVEGTQKEQKIKRTKMSRRCIFYDAYIFAPAAGRKIVGGDVLTPHTKGPLKNPTPLPFLKVLPEVTFRFSFGLHDVKWAELHLSKEDLKALFKEILLFLGMGAKTNVGYGQLTDRLPDEAQRALRKMATRYRPQPIIPGGIPRNATNILATLVVITDGHCAFQFEYNGQTFQFVKSIANITKKWQKKGYDLDPIVGTTYKLLMNADIVEGQKNPNFTVSKPAVS